MNVQITDRKGLLGASLRKLAERRLEFALQRFASRIRSVRLVVDDINGPRGGIDKTCRVTVGIRGIPVLVISDQDSELAKCLSRVADRLGATVSREVERLTRVDRQRPVAFDIASTAVNHAV